MHSQRCSLSLNRRDDGPILTSFAHFSRYDGGEQTLHCVAGVCRGGGGVRGDAQEGYERSLKSAYYSHLCVCCCFILHMLFDPMLPPQEQWKNVVTKDQWALVLDFATQISPDFANYSDEGKCW